MPVSMPRRSTLRSQIFRHDNNYGVDPRSDDLRLPRLSVSCVVPYYETGPLALECVARLSRALRLYESAHVQAPLTQITVVDDGSTERPFPENVNLQRQYRLIKLPDNRGRSAARNIGLRASSDFDITLFVDSDVLVQDDQIVRTCELWDSGASDPWPQEAVVANLFSTLRVHPEDVNLDKVLQAASITSDWRWSCRYQPSWVGDTGDWMYVGQKFQLVSDTDFFRQWTGMVGPWALPNMVLGGCFGVPTNTAIQIGGFDESFATYGFTETTLVTKLIAHGIPVIPQVKAAAVHVENNPNHHSQKERNALFRIAHRKFFTEFIANELI